MTAKSDMKLTDLIRPFDGTGDVGEWISKLELVAELRKIEDLGQVLPLFLDGPAYAVYSELGASQKKDVKAVKTALTDAFGMNAFLAYEQFIQRTWRDEAVDVYLTDLRRLARLAGILSEELLKRAFVVGLPSSVSRELRASAKVNSLSLPEIVERARALMAELVQKPVVAAAAGGVAPGYANKGKRVQERRCYGCGGPHLIKNCPAEKKFVCWTCGKEGHTAKNCGQGNGQGRVSAPEALPNVE